MINSYQVKDKKLFFEELSIEENSQQQVDQIEQIQTTLWLDLIDINPTERRVVQDTLGINLARNVELEDIEASARFFEEDEVLHLHSFFYCEDESEYPDLETVAFSLFNNRLITLRSRDLPTFRLYRLRSRKIEEQNITPYKILLDLLEIKTEQLADILENSYSDIEKIGRQILDLNKHKDYDLQETLTDLANYEDISSKVQLCLMDTQRALSYLIRKIKLSPEELDQARDILRDINSITPNNENLFQRLDFLMQASLGKINIEQNQIIKMFSLVSVVFLPPTLVASIYGMNFTFMPELQTKYGYPLALLFMLFSAIGPLLYFKYKKWM